MTPTSSWLMLVAAGLLEVVFALGLKSANGLQRPWILAGTLLVLAASLALLNLALRHLPVGTAYAVWTGIGAVGTALMGVLWMGDSASIGRLACMGLIVGGVMGLRWLP
ncbi:multidrug efflux SMR transporter [Metapseudomonas lalkuanensis]|uniref:Guanidinium exporter n=1 Tax=Metapseudomonas lalkuanensis TaxID=2604832 RepID=A0A5J6QP38_9GAMM|nr:multidrug efflux SMR transporter [Pseudomonas lalkuanensis]QEY64193.1 multidrug efflux SMR transporter [Pseudomonas lalkuanensis]UCO96810.1 multidrug efflux SMR transporter [Pseudomonas lalkuanensis]